MDYDDNRIPLDDDDEFPGPDETVPADDPNDPLSSTRMLALMLTCIFGFIAGIFFISLYRLLQTLEVIAP